MKKLYYLVCVIILWTNTASAQKWWYAVENCIADQHCQYEYMTIEVSGDTVIGGHSCLKLQKSSLTCYDITYVSYIYNDSTKVYGYNTSLNNFVLLYDFSMNVGDSINIISSASGNSDTCSYNYIVHEKDSISINNVRLPVFNNEIIGRIGNIETYLFPALCPPGGDVVDDCFNGQVLGLRCYEDSIIGHYQRWDSIPCDTIYYTDVSGVQQVKSDIENVVIYPNPVTDFFSVKGLKNSSLLYLYETNGALIKEMGIANEKKDISFLNAGIYVLEIADTHNKISSFKKITKL